MRKLFILITVLILNYSYILSIDMDKLTDYTITPQINFEKISKTNKDTTSYSTISIEGYISFWKQKLLENSYDLPEIIKKNIAVNTTLKIYNSLEYTDFSSILINEVEGIKVKISFYSICSKIIDNHCDKYYFVTQIELKGNINSFCAGYFNKDDFIPFPVLICAGNINNTRIGITLHRIKY